MCGAGQRRRESIYKLARDLYNLYMDWKDYIVADPAILGGKPAVKGTRISLEFIIERLAQGWTQTQLLENYPRLTAEHLQAVFAYLHECIEDGLLISHSPKAN